MADAFIAAGCRSRLTMPWGKHIQQAFARFFPGGKALPVLFLIFLGSAFIIRPAPLWSMTFYLGVLPAALYRLWRGPPFNWRNIHIILIFLLILWSALTLLWGENPGGGRVLKYFLDAIFTTLYFIALVTVLRDHPESRRRIGTTLIFAGLLNAALSITLFLLDLQPYSGDSRLVGWAETRHSILGAMVIGVCYIFAADRVLRERKSRPLNIVAAGLCLAFIVMTKSRGPLLAVVAATVVLTYGYSRRLGLATAGITLAVVAAVIVAATLHLAMVTDIYHQILDRGTSYRLDIWSFTLARVADRPFFGHGLAAYLGMSSFFTFPHNLFLSTLFYTGIVGLTLLLVLVVSIIIHLIRAWHWPGTPLLFALWVNVLCGGLTDIGQLTPGPSPLWFFFWLPLGLICTHLTTTEEGAHKSARPENGDTGTMAPG